MKKPSSLHRLLFTLALLCTSASVSPQPHTAPLFITGPALSVDANANQHSVAAQVLVVRVSDPLHLAL